jgi:hypothetical protein
MIMEEALAELDTLNSNKDTCYVEIAKKHSVARSTLSRKHRGISDQSARDRCEARKAAKRLQQALKTAQKNSCW